MKKNTPLDSEVYYNYGIKFEKELSNNSLVFLIVDDNYKQSGGYVVVSPTGIPSIINDGLYEIDEKNLKHVESLAKAFYEATKKFYFKKRDPN